MSIWQENPLIGVSSRRSTAGTLSYPCSETRATLKSCSSFELFIPIPLQTIIIQTSYCAHLFYESWSTNCWGHGHWV